MNWATVVGYLEEMVVAGTITLSTALAALGGWPTRFQWLVVVTGSAAAGLKAAHAYWRKP